MMSTPKTKLGRPPMPKEQRAESQIQLRVHRRRKAAYVRAAKGPLAEWCFKNLDAAANYNPNDPEIL